MTQANERHQLMLAALRAKQFTRLFAREYRQTYYLVVVIGDTPHVYASHTGRKKVYSHVSQMQSWLKDSFGITAPLAVETKIG